MKKLFSVLITVAVAILFIVPVGVGAPDSTSEVVSQSQTTCPVMGGAINKDLFVDHDGKRIYVCCQGCIAPIEQDPEKYISKLESEGVVLDKVQTVCPVMGGPIDKNQYVDHDGKRIYVCCMGCIALIETDPEKYIDQLESEGITLDKAED